MRRRKLLLVVSAMALLGVAGFFLFLWLTSPTPGVTWENFRRLREGMTLEDVETLLGKPNNVRFNSRSEIVRWRGEGIVIRLDFYLNERVRGGAAYPQVYGAPPHPFEINLAGVEYVPPAYESLFDRIRRWLHW